MSLNPQHPWLSMMVTSRREQSSTTSSPSPIFLCNRIKLASLFFHHDFCCTSSKGTSLSSLLRPWLLPPQTQLKSMRCKAGRKKETTSAQSWPSRGGSGGFWGPTLFHSRLTSQIWRWWGKRKTKENGKSKESPGSGSLSIRIFLHSSCWAYWDGLDSDSVSGGKVNCVCSDFWIFPDKDSGCITLCESCTYNVTRKKTIFDYQKDNNGIIKSQKKI